jgi:hypothetical protein
MPPVNLGVLVEDISNQHHLQAGQLAAIAKTESNFKVNAQSYTGTKGLMQITQATWDSFGVDIGVYSTDPQKQLEVGARILEKYNEKYDDPRLVYLAYNAGEGVSDRTVTLMSQLNIPYDKAADLAIAEAYPGNPRKQEEARLYPYKVLQNQGITANISIETLKAINNEGKQYFGVDNTDTPNATELTGEAVSDDVIRSLTPVVVITEGLDEKPWYQDLGNGGMVVGNPALKQFVAPISFEIRVAELGGESIKTQNGQPLSIQLNASINRFDITSGHVINRVNSRTALHVTMWGQQPDVIQGGGSTGVFMNQLGLTHFMSLVKANDEVTRLIQAAFKGNQEAAALALKDGGLRVAAQDAFAEFLSLFKMNGVFYFRNQNFYNPDKSGSSLNDQQSGTAAWSPSTGSNNFQNNARYNDVLTRGYVVFKMRNNVYLGYFKSLTWVMDAQQPFQWNFNFVFQVERTLSLLYTPKLAQATSTVPIDSSIPGAPGFGINGDF